MNLCYFNIISVKSLEESGFLIKGVCEIIQNETKEQKRIFQYVIRYIRR